jgi:hypothetical protein
MTAEPATLPWLFLDVDGVVFLDEDERAEAGRSDVAWPDTEPRKFRINHGGGYAERFRVLVSKEQAAAVARLRFDLVWATNWGHWANRHAGERLHIAYRRPFLVPPHRPAPGSSMAGWKPAAIAAFVRDNPRPFAFVDDNTAGMDLTVLERTAEQVGVRFLVLTTDPMVGLTPDGVAELARFAASLDTA